MITTEFKKQVIAALQQRRDLFSGTDTKFAVSIGISGPQYSRIKNGETERVLSDQVWITLSRLCNVNSGNGLSWVTANTPVFQYITAQLTFCQQHSASRQLCDVADIGKSHAGQDYAAKNSNVVYVDCSQVKSKNKLIRYLAKSFGVGHDGKYGDVYDDLVYYIRTLTVKPLIILDEAGDLTYEADLETKALWNATEGLCGWYKMGADGLKRKFERRIISKKVGYTELHSRFGNSYQKASPDGEHELKEFKMLHSAMIIRANFPAGVDINKTIAKADYTLRNLKDERRKLSA
jgi:hypothetical protein